MGEGNVVFKFVIMYWKFFKLITILGSYLYVKVMKNTVWVSIGLVSSSVTYLEIDVKKFLTGNLGRMI